MISDIIFSKREIIGIQSFIEANFFITWKVLKEIGKSAKGIFPF